LDIRTIVLSEGTYQELASDQDDNTAPVEGGLGIECGNNVLDLPEGEVDELLDDGSGAEEGVGLEGQHGVLAL
jgi:hypothetical protein